MSLQTIPEDVSHTVPTLPSQDEIVENYLG